MRSTPADRVDYAEYTETRVTGTSSMRARAEADAVLRMVSTS